MTQSIYAVAGKRIYIGTAPITVPKADLTASSFTTVTWTEIDGWETHGEFGDTFALVAAGMINRSRDHKAKGTANGGGMANNFVKVPGDAGQALLTTALASKYNYPVRILENDTPDVKTATVTMSSASPGVITWTAHGLAANTAVVFTTTGALYTGLTAGTTYYVKTVASADTFTVSAEPGGSAINTSGSQSGTHTGTTVPAPSEYLFAALIMSAAKAGGSANTVDMIKSTFELNSNIVPVAALG